MSTLKKRQTTFKVTSALAILSFSAILRSLVSSEAFPAADLAVNALLLIASSLYLAAAPRKTSLPRRSDIPLALMLFTLTLSALNSPVKQSCLVTMCDYTAIIILSYTVKRLTPEETGKLISAILISGMCVSLYSLRSLFIISNHIPPAMLQEQKAPDFVSEVLSQSRAFAPFICANLLAGYLTMLIPISLMRTGQEIRTARFPALPIHSTALFAMLVTLVFTKSLGAWGALLLAYIIATALKGSPFKKASRALLISLPIITAIFLARENSVLNIATPGFSLEQRLSYLQETLKHIATHPFCGTGLNNFCLKETLFAHNSHLQIWAETGILGISAWAMIIFVFLKKGVKALRTGTDAVKKAAFISGLAFLFHNCLDFSFFIPQVSFLWWIIFAIVTSAGTEPAPHNSFNCRKDQPL